MRIKLTQTINIRCVCGYRISRTVRHPVTIRCPRCGHTYRFK